MKQILRRTPTDRRFIERSVFIKEVINQNHWNFELKSQENMNFPTWIIIGFLQRDRQDTQNLNNGSFSVLPVVRCQSILVTEKYPDAGVILFYDDDDCSQGYCQVKEAFTALSKYDILQPYISDDDFRSSNVRVVAIGYTLYVFDIQYQQSLTFSQPFKVDFNFYGIVPNEINGHALLLKNKMVCVNSDGQRRFDLI